MDGRYRLRDDLNRAALGDFALPLGITGAGLTAPTQGYTISYAPGEDEDPDTYAFNIVVSHERLAPLIYDAFALLPHEVYAIFEIGSRDAYRTIDVYIGSDTIEREWFVQVWREIEPLLLEDCSLAAGANSEDPFVEVFLDQWKTLMISVPLDMRSDVDELLARHGIQEVNQTWPADIDDRVGETAVRPVMVDSNEVPSHYDNLLIDLRHAWQMELNVDPENNTDEAGRELGMTLWHTLLVVENVESELPMQAYMSVWATAASLADVEDLIDDVIDMEDGVEYIDTLSVDRVAFDERPQALTDLSPRRDRAEVHLVHRGNWYEVDDELDDDADSADDDDWDAVAEDN